MFNFTQLATWQARLIQPVSSSQNADFEARAVSWKWNVIMKKAIGYAYGHDIDGNGHNYTNDI